MTQYIIRRVLLMIPTIMGVSLVVMGMIRMLPGDAVDILVSENVAGGGAQGFETLIDQELREPSWPGVEPHPNPEEAGFLERNTYGLDVLAQTDQVRRLAAEAGVDLSDTQTRRDFVEALPSAQRMDIRNSVALEVFKDEIRARLGLDKNFFAQWWSWFSGAIQGDFGTSIVGTRSVNDELGRRLPVTFQLGILAMIFGALVAIPTGIISAVKQDTWVDYFVRSSAVAMLALPSFFLAILTMALLSRWFSYAFPLYYSRLWDDPLANMEQVVVAAFILGLSLSGILMRLTRAQMLEVMRQDYIRTARSKGLANNSVVIGHAVRNAMLPIVTILGIQIPVLIGGSVVIEVIFGLPGVAAYLYQSINQRDFPPIIAINVIIAIIVVIANLVVDVTYAYLDPRVSLS